MLGAILYILGIIAAVWCVLDVLKKNLDPVLKIVIIVAVLLTSWFGLAAYYFIIRKRI